MKSRIITWVCINSLTARAASVTEKLYMHAIMAEADGLLDVVYLRPNGVYPSSMAARGCPRQRGGSGDTFKKPLT